MSIRPLELFDLPTLYRYRSHAATLDVTRLLTRGNPLGAAGFLTYFNPSRHIYSAITEQDGPTLIGSVVHTRGETLARLLYLAPLEDLENSFLTDLVEHLSSEAGRWGVHHVIAEIEEHNPAFQPLRKAGFSIYAWQRIWDVSAFAAPNGRPAQWRRAREVDLPVIQSLHHEIVPGLLHPFEESPKKAAGLHCCTGETQGYASLVQGDNGIVATPMIHPEVAEAAEKLIGLASCLPDRHNRPVYFRVRSYQAWLEPVLEDLGAKASRRQAVMVKHLVHTVKAAQTAPAVQPSAVGIQPSRVSHVRAKTER